MSTIPQSSPGELSLSERLSRLETRLTQLEQHLGLEVPGLVETVAVPPPPGTPANPTAVLAGGDEFEIELGQNWFAKVGIVVLALGVVFLLTLPLADLPPWLPSLTGAVVAVGLGGLSRKLASNYAQIARYLLGGSLLLLYFATLRLSFFGAEPALAHRGVLVGLLLIVGLFNLTVAARRGSPYLAAIHLGLGCVTGLVSGSDMTLLVLLLMVAAGYVWFERRLQTGVLPWLGMLWVLAAHSAWAAGNPLLGNGWKLVREPEANLAFLLGYAAVAAAGVLSVRRSGEAEESPAEMGSTVVAGAGSYLLFLGLTLTTFETHFLAWHLAASLLYLALATLFWVRRQSRFSTFVLAMIGYAAMSAAIVKAVSVPAVFIWLCWESIVVVSTAVWFRSRFIVVANFLIFLAIFGAYLLTAGSVTWVSIGFGLVALATARILNWRRDRLELKTEIMRNAYLATALFVIPYSVYHAVPRGLVSISWLGIAAAYYVASRVLRNSKYRWMALLTMALTVIWVFAVDLVALSRALRIVSFLVLGCTLLAISMVYSRRSTEGSAASGRSTDGPAPAD